MESTGRRVGVWQCSDFAHRWLAKQPALVATELSDALLAGYEVRQGKVKYIGPSEVSARILRAHSIQPSELDRPMVRREFSIRNFKWANSTSCLVWNDFLRGWSRDRPRLSQYIQGRGANFKSNKSNEPWPVAGSIPHLAKSRWPGQAHPHPIAQRCNRASGALVSRRGDSGALAAFAGELFRCGDGRQVTAGEHVLEQVDELGVDESV